MIPATGIPRARSVPALLLVLLLAGCSGDPTPLSPAPSQDGAGEPAMEREFANGFRIEPAGRRPATLENIWPNEDGRFWLYQIEQRSWDGLGIRYYPRAADVPPLPRLDAILELLRRRPAGRSPVIETARYTMQFQGLRTTLSGVTGQNLATALTLPGGIGPAASPMGLVPAHGQEGGFMSALRRARPDLAPKLASQSSLAVSAPAIAASVQMPTFLFGYVWEKTREYIGSYGDLNTQLAWKYLEADLRPGHTFRMQLVPDLADDVFLYARVLREGPSFSGVGAVRNAIEVLYVIDFGLSVATDMDGNVIGYSRMFSFGTITYAPFIGPIASYERGLIQTGPLIGTAMYDQSITLLTTLRELPN